ncbi:MBL fold metallo-hydrolase [Chitinophaga silvatica]|uniref:MBL fold metallo-hydrolase n=1 Tax=Chitinophaga silvatica TaxID=2282649 RepID=A0A3E1YI03_9BACT|nr:MBL fold metallo-hydrolase [Chitinophaga silvatica]RFS27001.1 MBL fold metallo-hydrolase [Chitinophaga silvatica]
MDIRQFEDKGLAHYSYAIYSKAANQIVLIDPSRDLTPYLKYAASMNAAITAVIETHPHADFVSGHLELHKKHGAVVYCSRLVGASYPYTGFDEGEEISFGDIVLKALNTPGHSPDSISIVLVHHGQDKAVFTGDTLFIGDCGRPDLREGAGNIKAAKEDLARQMFHSLREKLMVLPDNVLVFPAHGAGSLCGRSLSTAHSSTIAAERIGNWSVQPMTIDTFVEKLVAEQPFIPKYFPYDVALNREGAPCLQNALSKVPIIENLSFEEGITIIDTRPEQVFKQGHLPNAINLQDGGKFETWLGSIIAPDEYFYLVGGNAEHLQQVIHKTAKIGYEVFIKGATVLNIGKTQMPEIPLENFREHPENYTIVDIRMPGEIAGRKIFSDTINIPLDQLRERVGEIPVNKPIVVHCAGGYRSAAGSSIVADKLQNKVPVYDLSEAVNTF